MHGQSFAAAAAAAAVVFGSMVEAHVWTAVLRN